MNCNIPAKHTGTALSSVLRTVLVLATVLTLAAVPAFAAVVQPSGSFYVTDEADVISAETEEYIISKNAELEQSCSGAQIAVVTVDFLDGMDIEDYTYKVFNEWQPGSADEDNGVLLLLTIGEENYWCMQGKGLENTLTSGTIDDILWYDLEPDFAAGDYDAGVKKTFDSLYSEICSIYGVSGSSVPGGAYEGTPSGGYYDGSDAIEYAGSAVHVMIWVVTIIAVLAIMLVVLYIFTALTRSRTQYRRRPPYSPPPGPGGVGVPPPQPRRSRPIIFIGGGSRRHSGPGHSSGGHLGGGGGSSRGGGAGRSTSRSSFGGGGHSSFGGGGMGRGGGGMSRGGGAGRRGR